MPTEIEAKFRADDDAPLTMLEQADALGPAKLGPGRSVDEVDIYLDTERGDLAAAGWACRLRSRTGQVRVSLKGPAQGVGDAWLHQRPEVEGPATEDLDPPCWPPSEARDLVDRLRQRGALIKRFTLRQRRVERLVSVGARELGTLSLDRATVEHRGDSLGELNVVELELHGASTPDDQRLLGELAAALDAVPGLVAEERTKLEHAVELIAAR
jgi:inorganic triphosphatase YgiF